MKLGIDIGGTFTDLVLLEPRTGKLYFGKTLTTYPDPTLGIVNGIDELLAQHGKSIRDVTTLIHGTTLVTNAIIERKGAPTALLTTAGFEDVLEIGREMRYDIYDIFIKMPEPLVGRTFRKGVAERIDHQGKIITHFQEKKVIEIVQSWVKKGIQSVAVSLLHAYANPIHEQKIGSILTKHFPHLSFSLSSEVMPEIREYERTSATVMNAYVQPLTGKYLHQLTATLKEKGFTGKLHIMNSAGRLTTIAGAIQTPVQLLESGPAGGTMAGIFFGKLVKKKDLLAFDMGGTTAKASMIRNGKPEITNHFEAAREKRFKKGSGLPVRIPVIDMIEIGAGGGSIAHINPLGLLTVGPESAASQPGPACYNRGGQFPTVTDADLVLGFLDPDYFLGGTMRLNKLKAEEAIQKYIARPLHISVEAAAWGIHRLVNENMANAARVHIIEKGLDPRHFSMLGFGGAGPVHAFQVARQLNAKQLIIPAGAGVLSALGFLVSPVATENITSYIKTLNQIDWSHLNKLLNGMAVQGKKFLQNAGIANSKITISIIADMRYAGQGHEISVPIPKGKLSAASIPAITREFLSEYRLRYGRDIQGIPIEAVTWRVLVSGPSTQMIPKQSVVGKHTAAYKGKRNIFWGNQWIQTPVYDRYLLQPNKVIKGPCIIEEFESTTVIGLRSTVKSDSFNNLIIDLI
ncbi:MAG: hydantoinase/oxoprolinase family protein [Chitinophagia bacterium]|nr:hydantoinase/oxoprolinase family protein [Chitinophagia bacterium]